MGADGSALCVKKIAESTWRAMEWVCDKKSIAVIDSLNNV